MPQHSPNSDPRHAIEAYFKGLDHFFTSTSGFKASKSSIKKLFYYAFSDNRIPNAGEIPLLRNFQREFNKLLELTWQMQDAGLFSFFPFNEDVFQPSGHPRTECYVDILAIDAVLPWEYYPRYLSRQEFINPQGFFEIFFACNVLLGWKTILEELFHAGLLHQSVINFSQNVINPHELQHYLFVFLECSHLLRVRHRYLFANYF